MSRIAARRLHGIIFPGWAQPRLDELKMRGSKGAQQSDLTDTIVQIGPVNAKGGIASVIHSVLGSGEVQRRFRVVTIGTSLYRDAPAWRELAVSAKALFRFGRMLLLDRSIVLVHMHSSYGVSFYRKSLFAFISRCMGVPYVFHIHTGRVLEFLCSGPTTRRIHRGVLGHAARVVLLSPTFADPVRLAFPGVATQVVSNPVTLPVDSGAARSRRLRTDRQGFSTWASYCATRRGHGPRGCSARCRRPDAGQAEIVRKGTARSRPQGSGGEPAR